MDEYREALQKLAEYIEYSGFDRPRYLDCQECNSHADPSDEASHVCAYHAAKALLARPDPEHDLTDGDPILVLSEYTGEPQGIRDRHGFICHFHRVPYFHGQDERHQLDLAQRKRQVEAILAALGGSNTAAAEKAREPKPEDMAMLIRQLCSALNRFNPGGPTAIRAMQYLASHGLEGSVLRDLPSPPAATGEK